MNRFTKLGLTLALSLAMLAGGCDSTSKSALKLEASQAALTTTGNIEENLTSLSEVLQFLEDFVLVQKGYQAADGAMVCSAPIIYNDTTGEPIGEGEEVCEFEASEAELEVTLDQMADDIVAKLNQYVFVDSQIEQEAGEAVVYLLAPTVFCGIVASEDESDTPTAEGRAADSLVDGEDEESGDLEECQDFLTKVPVRLRFVSHAEGDIEVDVLVGEEQVQAIHLEFLHNSLVAEMDAASFKQVIEIVTEAMGEDGENPVEIQVMEGRFRVELTRLTADRFSLSFEVLEALQESLVIEGETYAVSVGAGSIEAIADKAAKTVSMTTDLGAVSLTFPYQRFIDGWYQESVDEPEPYPMEGGEADSTTQAPQVQGVISLSVAGFSFEGTLAENNETFVVNNIGLGNGPATLKKDGATLISLDINPTAGRAFDLSVGLNDAQHVVVGVSPQLDVVLMWALGQIAADVTDLPAEMADETWRMTLDGADKPEIEFLEGDTKDFIKVLSGNLSMSSTAALDQTVTAAGGQCVAWAEEEEPATPMPVDDVSDAEGHAMLSAFVAGACTQAQ